MCPVEKVVVTSVCDVLFFITKLSQFRTQLSDGSEGCGVMVVSHSRGALELSSRVQKLHVPVHTFSLQLQCVSRQRLLLSSFS